MIMHGHLYSTKTKVKIEKRNKAKHDKIQKSLFLNLLYSSARVKRLEAYEKFCWVLNFKIKKGKKEKRKKKPFVFRVER